MVFFFAQALTATVIQLLPISLYGADSECNLGGVWQSVSVLCILWPVS
jgi:hypothetical protein